MNSAIYTGYVRHQRFKPKKHGFRYRLFMMAIDLDESHLLSKYNPFLGMSKWNALRFNPCHYLTRDKQLNKSAVWHKVESLGGEQANGKVILLAQMSCFGFYFSPVNFYYCYEFDGDLKYLLAEVSNTPWNERHYYLIDSKNKKDTPKNFHVSPFMNLDMDYRWKFKAPSESLFVHIENHKDDKIFDATLSLKRKELNRKNLFSCLMSLPFMTLKIVFSIYWQALKIYLKKIPYVPYVAKDEERI